MGSGWFLTSVAALAVASLATGTLYRTWLAAGHRGRFGAALACVAALAALVWLGSGNGWVLTALILFAAFVLVTRIVGPWAALVWSRPASRASLDSFPEAFADRLVRRPASVARVECYHEYAILDCGYSLLDSIVGRNGVQFPYAGSCVICAVERGFEAAEEAGSLPGIADDFRRQYAEQPRFVLAFKMRPPAVLWQWGRRPAAPSIVPQDLCATHQPPAAPPH